MQITRNAAGMVWLLTLLFSQYPASDLISTGIHCGHAGLPVFFHVSVIKKKNVQVRNMQLKQKKSPS